MTSSRSHDDPRVEESGGSSPRTRRGRETKALLIQAARDRFQMDGYLNVTVPGIAATAGRSPASFYTYFDSKADLLATLMAAALDRLRSDLDRVEHQAPVDAVVKQCVTILWHAYRRDLPIFRASFEVAVQEGQPGLWSQLRAVVVAAVERAQHRATADVSPMSAASSDAVASMIEMFAFVWLSEGGDDPGRQMDDATAIDTLSRLWLAPIERPAAGNPPDPSRTVPRSAS